MTGAQAEGVHTVVGATGRVGSACIKALRRDNVSVRGVVRNSQQQQHLQRLGCASALADLRDRASLIDAFEGSLAIHLICPILPGEKDAMAKMLNMVDTMLAAAQAARPKRVVIISDYGAQHETGTGLTTLFHQFEARALALDTELTFLRSAEHMQNWARAAQFASRTGTLPTLHTPIEKAFPTVSAIDVGLQAARLLRAPSSGSHMRIVHLEGPKRYTALEVAETLSRVLQRDITPVSAPKEQWPRMLSEGGMSVDYAQLVSDLYESHNQGLIDVEDNGETALGTSTLFDVFSSLLPK